LKANPVIIKKLISDNEDLIRDAAGSCRIKGLAVEDLDGNQLLKYGSVTGSSAASATYPVIVGEETIGFVIETEKVPYIASLISNLIGSGIEKINLAKKNTRLSHDLHESFKESAITMAEPVEIRDYRTGNHVKRVAEYSSAIGKELDLDEGLIDITARII
jgi:HD-GYP domain-containing protein (c-di-GMP phosphodiesterase class II)